MSCLLVLGHPTTDFLQSVVDQHSPQEVRVLHGDEYRNAQDVFFSDMFQWVLEKKPLVITFTEGWKGASSLLTELFAHLTGRSIESVQYFLFDMGVEVKSVSSFKGLLSIKDVMSMIDNQKLSEPQRLRLQILGELIR